MQSRIELNVLVLTVGWSPVTQRAISEFIQDNPFNKETERPTSTGSFSMILSLESSILLIKGNISSLKCPRTTIHSSILSVFKTFAIVVSIIVLELKGSVNLFCRGMFLSI